jgi:hypothetical protein
MKTIVIEFELQIQKGLIDNQSFIDVVYREPQFPEFIKRIDWKLLREQKQFLLDIISCEEGIPKIQHLRGIVHLLDALMDYASDDMGLGDKMVFNLNEEEENGKENTLI